MTPTEMRRAVRRERARAKPMSPEERLDRLVDTTLTLLREHGRSVTTRQIAEAAGVAEGTIFRVVDSKDELVERAITRAFEPGALIERIQEIDLAQPLPARLVTLVAILQQRFRATFELMRKVGMVRPADSAHDSPEAVELREYVHALLEGVVGEDRALLSVPVRDFVHRLRLMTFAGSHPLIADGELLAPEEIVDTLLHGLLRKESES
ncbi:TetR/AcrR family transcriptional regulator [Nocardioides anomalus]|uniref:TetR/AcrR family transcriptional regulator n=1 Tax=Nocardioides anomalus TaxID=2712223 RepID=A0A6G6W7X6_9ACTN|nr:TetR/AcrR family transcriptional regulator [Nocardioides anomalus]QIG41438.1 TetR/AcrR family transcriptional regulator [Nocardioides anomalus]